MIIESSGQVIRFLISIVFNIGLFSFLGINMGIKVVHHGYQEIKIPGYYYYYYYISS